MVTFPEAMDAYREQIERGLIQQAYQGLMQYMQALRARFEKTFPGDFVSGSIYAGVMDMTYFSLSPERYKERGLKIAVVFLHPTFRFEVWLSGYNRPVQARYWKLLRAHDCAPYHLVDEIQGSDSILEHILAAPPDFTNLPALTRQIEAGTREFLQGTDALLARVDGEYAGQQP